MNYVELNLENQSLIAIGRHFDWNGNILDIMCEQGQYAV